MLLNGFFWALSNYKNLYDVPGLYDITLLPGKYKFICRGAGGAGGENGTNRHSNIGGKGGAGANGDIVIEQVTISETTNIQLFVGSCGDNGGAGGAGGESNNGGAGGAGGKPSYVIINNNMIIADGGAGGGGGGGSAGYGRYADGGAGGGGGGLYKVQIVDDNINILSVPGKQGAPALNNVSGVNGTAGNTADYPSLRSGGGAPGYSADGSSGASGGGASGGSGGTTGNNQTASSGGGGAGAGGSDKAGGGGATAGARPGSAASNHFTTPVDTTAENAEYGIIGNYGMGGTSATAGKDGFVLITREA